MKLILNADDLGLSKGVNYGIYEAHQHGLVKSATLMVNMAAAEHAVKLFENSPEIGIGLHFTLDAGKPVSNNVPSLIDENGNFKKGQRLLDTYQIEDVRTELEAQISKATNLGVKLTHMDSHHHIHMFTDEIFTVFQEIAKKHNLPIRCGEKFDTTPFDELVSTDSLSTKTSEQFTMEFYNEKATYDDLIRIIEENKHYTSLEVMCHPAFVCNDLASSYNTKRLTELEVLTDQKLTEYLNAQEIEVVNFKGM